MFYFSVLKPNGDSLSVSPKNAQGESNFGSLRLRVRFQGTSNCLRYTRHLPNSFQKSFIGLFKMFGISWHSMSQPTLASGPSPMLKVQFKWDWNRAQERLIFGNPFQMKFGNPQPAWKTSFAVAFNSIVKGSHARVMVTLHLQSPFA